MPSCLVFFWNCDLSSLTNNPNDGWTAPNLVNGANVELFMVAEFPLWCGDLQWAISDGYYS